MTAILATFFHGGLSRGERFGIFSARAGCGYIFSPGSPAVRVIYKGPAPTMVSYRNRIADKA